MNKSRRKFLGKAPAVALAAGVGVGSGKIAMASPPTSVDGTRPLLDAVIAGQGMYNGFL
ncbi:MAG TPA: twin-arginine translocation signal domain-containing protein [Pyrinomonadaceae bacterium]